jgi:hypothetical protein
VRLQVLHVPGCPHAAVLVARLVHLLPSPAEVEHWVVRDHDEAVTLGMHGSPSLLIDGVDPFAVPDQPASLSCRLYRDENGSLASAPSLVQLHQALETRGISHA